MNAENATLLQHALACQRQGRLIEARTAYQAWLAEKPNDLNALHYLGALEYEAGHFADAISLMERALRLDSALPPVLFNLAMCHLARGDDHLAESNLRNCIAAEPNHIQAHLQLGIILAKRSVHAEALELFDQALRLNPNLAQVHNLRGNVLLDLAKPEAALRAYDQALRLAPDDADSHNNKGNALRDLLRLQQALESYSSAIALQPRHVDALNNRGNVWLQLRRVDRAETDYRNALALAPTYGPTLRNLGAMHAQLGQHALATEYLESAISVSAGDSIAHAMRGESLRELGRIGEARLAFDRALAINPNIENMMGARLQAQTQVCDWSDVSRRLTELAQEAETGSRVCSPFNALGWFDEPALHHEIAASHARAHCPHESALGPIITRAQSPRIRLGYYSADFHNHATAYLMAELFELHDREQFEVFAFSFGPKANDEMRHRLVNAFDHFIEVQNLGDIEIAALSRQLEIDIAVDLKGYCKDSRAAIFAHRCAPIQVSYLAYPGTLGMSCMDYIIADKIVLPPDQHVFYSETVAYLPHCYQVNDSKRAIAPSKHKRTDLGLPEDAFVFCSFNNNYKILPATFDLWMRIIGRVERSVLWLLKTNEDVVRNLRHEARLRGIDPNRIVFASPVPLGEHLARHSLADLSLDTLPYNAHTTASDALWADLPIVTLIGCAFAGRVAASLLTAVGLPELIARSAAEYEAVAVGLANDPARLATVKDKLHRQRKTHPLFNTPLLCSNIETIYKEMLSRHHRGQKPSPMDLWPNS